MPSCFDNGIVPPRYMGSHDRDAVYRVLRHMRNLDNAMQLGRAVRIFFLHQILQVNTAMPPPFQELRAITNFGQFTSQTSSTTADKSCPPTITPSALTEKSKTFLRERFFAFARSSRKAGRPEDPAPTLTIFTKGEWPGFCDCSWFAAYRGPDERRLNDGPYQLVLQVTASRRPSRVQPTAPMMAFDRPDH